MVSSSGLIDTTETQTRGVLITGGEVLINRKWRGGGAYRHGNQGFVMRRGGQGEADGWHQAEPLIRIRLAVGYLKWLRVTHEERPGQGQSVRQLR